MDRLLAVGLALAVSTGAFYGCSSDDGKADSGIHPDATVHPDAETPDTGGGGFQQPPNTVAINFSIDDTANQTYTEGEMRWKGSFQYDRTTRILTHDPSWAGGDSSKYPPVYDDGPWTADGHEPAGSVAGDHKWGVAAFFTIPVAATNFEYGAEDNGGWIWRGPNGTFTVPAGSSTPVDVTGMTLPSFGQIDLKLEVDTSTLAGGIVFVPGTTTLTVKGSAWSWQEVEMDRSGATVKYEFVLGENVGPGTPRPHSGKLNSGDLPEFVFVIGGVEYKVGGSASKQGVEAYLKVPPATTFTEVQIETNPNNGNTYVVVP